jgi:hypothetical protein
MKYIAVKPGDVLFWNGKGWFKDKKIAKRFSSLHDLYKEMMGADVSVIEEPEAENK